MTNYRLTDLLKGSEDPGAEPARRRPSGWRFRVAALVPWALLAGFALLLAVVLGDRLVPAREVAIASVVTVESGDDEVGGRTASGDPFDAPMLFQASGWVEPDPYPILATALVDGVVDAVEVLEGETVEKGQLLATLIDDDAALDVRTAESRLASLEAQAAAHHGLIAVTEAEIATLGKQVLAAEAKRDELADEARRFARLGAGSVAEREVAQARLRVATQEAEIEALVASEQELRGRLRQLTEVANDFKARVGEAETELARRRLALDRTRIESPVDGIVLRLLSVPGQKKMLEMDDRDSAVVAILYRPEKLQARIDVPLAEAARLAVGQPVRLRSSFLPDRAFRGNVTRIVGEADLQRNTLQAKVRIDDPDPRLRPEMLCRAEFLAPSSEKSSTREEEGGSAAASGRVEVFVPEAALTDISGDTAKVWRIDDSGDRVALREVALGAERREDHRRVREGLKPGDRVVLAPPADLESGQRVAPEPSL